MLGLPSTLLEPCWAAVLVGVELVRSVVVNVVLIVHLFGLLLRLVLRLLAVEPVLALCLGKLVDLVLVLAHARTTVLVVTAYLSTGESGEHLLGECVRYWLA